MSNTMRHNVNMDYKGAKTKKWKYHNKNKLISWALLAMAIGFITWGGFELRNWNKRVPSEQGFSAEIMDIMGVQTCGPVSINKNDLYESFYGNREWFLLGDEFDDGDRILTLNLSLNEKYRDDLGSVDDLVVSYEVVDTSMAGDFVPEFGDEMFYHVDIPVENLDPGEYAVQANVDFGCGRVSSQKYRFNVSYPLYVTWTFDWEGYYVKQEYLDDIDELTTKHYDFPLTHFFNPRIYVTPTMSNGHAMHLTNWVKSRRDSHGHYIGLHLHMFNDMVEAAGVEPHDEPAWGWYSDDGYDILVSGYSYNDMSKILTWSQLMFLQNGLGDPTIFRAGGWFADEGTLSVLEAHGFVMDSSGRTSFVFGKNDVQSHWNLDATVAPYHPNLYDQNSDSAPNMGIWEFPNNGGDSWAFSKDEMLERYRQNYDGRFLAEKQTLTYLSHPEWFYEDKSKMDGLLNEIDRDLFIEDSGPVIYTTLDETYKVWAEVE